MGWLQLHIETSSEWVEQIENCLMDAGAVAVTLRDAQDNPVFEPELGTTPLWSEVKITALFTDDVEQSTIIDYLNQHAPSGIPLLHQFSYLADENWERKWMDQFHAMKFGQQLYICPSWETVDDANAVIIKLDPGLAFGTGTHPTTRLCLEWLANHPPKQLDVMDYGCGSGILAIAALKLGAQSMIAVDHDPQALLATRENAERNEINPDSFSIILPEQVTSPKVDLILANILANPLCSLTKTFASYLKPQGKIILSGILKEQQDLIVNAYQTLFSIIEINEHEGWLCVVAELK